MSPHEVETQPANDPRHCPCRSGPRCCCAQRCHGCVATLDAKLPPAAPLQNIHPSHSWDVRDACGCLGRPQRGADVEDSEHPTGDGTGSWVSGGSGQGMGMAHSNKVQWPTCAVTRCGYGRLCDMSTPSERIFAQIEDDTELRDFLPPQARHPMTLVRTADRIADGVALREAAADFLDDLRWARGHDDVAQRIADRPRDLDPRTDAYLGALAEHVAAERALAAPPWSIEAGRFLARIWWPRYPGLWARAIVESPAAFRRRGILLGAGMLSRV